jgi:hypothetical protein
MGHAQRVRARTGRGFPHSRNGVWRASSRQRTMIAALMVLLTSRVAFI